MSHSAFDLMVEFGFKNIALVGQTYTCSSGKHTLRMLISICQKLDFRPWVKDSK